LFVTAIGRRSHVVLQLDVRARRERERRRHATRDAGDPAAGHPATARRRRQTVRK
jgi:hypothetical protein